MWIIIFNNNVLQIFIDFEKFERLFIIFEYFQYFFEIFIIFGEQSLGLQNQHVPSFFVKFLIV